jgi:hypothetical protein
LIAVQPAPVLSGPLRFARYALMPNHLGYCGGDDNRALSLHWGWVCERVTDLEQRQLERFTRHHLQLANARL